MKNIHYYIVTLVVLLFMVAPAKAVSEAEFGKLHKTYILHTDGSQEMRVQKELTLFTHTAMNRLYGESFIVYNPEFQGLKIHESYPRQKDGNIVQTPENAFVEVLPSAAADAPAYNGLKEMVVVHTGLELGATIYLDYSVITRPGYLPELDVCEQIEELSPIREYVLSVSVPENKPLHYELLNGKAVPVVKPAGGVKTVTWALKNVQPRPSMLAVSLPAGNVQAIVASTYASKADALKVIKRQFESNDKEVSELAKRLTAPVSMDFKSVSSYGAGTVSSGVVRIIKDLDEPLEGKNVLIVEDIIDSGRTLAYLIEVLKQRGPADIRLCTLLDKPERRVKKQVKVDYTCFTIPDEFVVGYGLDYDQKYRNLPYIGVVEQEG